MPNTLFGNDRDNLLMGGGGDDLIVGFRGADRMGGESGNDTLFSSSTVTELQADGAIDLLGGGAGTDACHARRGRRRPQRRLRAASTSDRPREAGARGGSRLRPSAVRATDVVKVPRAVGPAQRCMSVKRL